MGYLIYCKSKTTLGSPLRFWVLDEPDITKYIKKTAKSDFPYPPSDPKAYSLEYYESFLKKRETVNNSKKTNRKTSDLSFTSNSNHNGSISHIATEDPFSQKTYDFDNTTVSEHSFEYLRVLDRKERQKTVLVKKKDTGLIYVAKIIQKVDVINSKAISKVKQENQILSSINHPFIVKLRYVFTSKTRIFMVFEYLPNGNIFDVLRKKKKLKEPQ